MTLFTREGFEAFVSGLAAASIVHQWGDASVAKIGGKIFAVFNHWHGDGQPYVSFKCSDLSYEMLPELEGVSKAKYLARAKWVEVRPGSPLSDDELRAYIVQAHTLISARLPKRVQAELGLAAG